MFFEIIPGNQTSTAETPYSLFFHRHPRIPEVTDTRPTEDTLSMVEGDPEEELERALTAVKALNAEVGAAVDVTRCYCCMLKSAD